MEDVELKLSNHGKGAFVIEQDGEQVAEMEIAVRDGNLTVFHTEVAEKLKGQGVASKLLTTMVAYARQKKLKVIPLCPYVLAQFKRHPDQYADIWNTTWHQN
jgi:uncharacterized protein